MTQWWVGSSSPAPSPTANARRRHAPSHPNSTPQTDPSAHTRQPHAATRLTQTLQRPQVSLKQRLEVFHVRRVDQQLGQPAVEGGPRGPLRGAHAAERTMKMGLRYLRLSWGCRARELQPTFECKLLARPGPTATGRGIRISLYKQLLPRLNSRRGRKTPGLCFTDAVIAGTRERGECNP
jgi:hypothetical protein